MEDDEYVEEENLQMSIRELEDLGNIYAEEIRYVMKLMKNEKIPVIDGLNNEIFKTGKE